MRYFLLIAALCTLAFGCTGSSVRTEVKTALDLTQCEPQIAMIVSDTDKTQRELDVLSLAVCIGKVVVKDMPAKASSPTDGGAAPPKG